MELTGTYLPLYSTYSAAARLAFLFSRSPISRGPSAHHWDLVLGEYGDDGRWDGGVVFLLSMLPGGPPLGAVPARLPPTPPLSNSATGAWPTAIGSRQRELGPRPACGSVLRCFQRSSCTRGTTSSESSESRLCDSRTGSASPACDGHTKGRVAHPPADTLRTVSQGRSKETPAVPGATCPNPPTRLRPYSAFRPPSPRCSRSPACPDRHGNRCW